MTEDEAELIQKLAMSLDTCCDVLVPEAARKERKAGAGQRLRPITWQERAKSFPALIDEARDVLIAAGKHPYF